MEHVVKEVKFDMITPSVSPNVKATPVHKNTQHHHLLLRELIVLKYISSDHPNLMHYFDSYINFDTLWVRFKKISFLKTYFLFEIFLAYFHPRLIFCKVVCEYCHMGSVTSIYSANNKPLTEDQVVLVGHSVLKAITKKNFNF